MKLKVTIEIDDQTYINEHTIEPDALKASTNPVKLKSDALFRLTKATQAPAQEYLKNQLEG